MTHLQWIDLFKITKGEKPAGAPIGFIIDSPWIPGWANISTLQYYSSEELWFHANKKVIETFPDVIFLPGFWSEFGMCTEPSAFGARLIWNEFSLPYAEKVLQNIEQVTGLHDPNPKMDGLLPFMIQRLKNYQDPIHKMGHEIKFAISRGPLNIASYLMGTTELMMALMTNPEETHQLLEKITKFVVNWLQFQKDSFPSIEGIMILDDLIGFVGKTEFRTFVLPSFKTVFNAFDSKVRFLHNDAQGKITASFLKEMNVNLFNFSFEHSINEIRDLAGSEVALLGNIPPRDVLAAGTPELVVAETRKMVMDTNYKSRIIWSCGGGMPQNVSTENLKAFIQAVQGTLK